MSETVTTPQTTSAGKAVAPSSAVDATPSRRRLRRPSVSGAARLVSPILLVALWQLASALGWLPERILPAPSLVLDAALELARSGELGQALLVSTGRVVQGLGLGLAVGIGLGALVGSSRFADIAVDPPLQALRALPHLGLIPLFILWFGIGETPKVLLIALGVMFPVYLNTASALRGVDRGLLEMARVFGFSRRRMITEVVIPSIAPQVLVGFRQSLALAWLTLVVAEQINATSGLGFLINNARDFLRVDVIIVGLVIYALLGITTDAAVRALERRATRYRIQ